LGVLVRSPEPLNDPKTPKKVRDGDSQDADLNGLIQLQVGALNSSNFKIIHSKDNANAFVTNADGTLTMPTGTYEFTFEYRLFDGNDYSLVGIPITDVAINVI